MLWQFGSQTLSGPDAHCTITELGFPLHVCGGSVRSILIVTARLSWFAFGIFVQPLATGAELVPTKACAAKMRALPLLSIEMSPQNFALFGQLLEERSFVASGVSPFKPVTVTPESIDSTAPLFVEGLGLDSIDALELAMALRQKYGVRTGADEATNRRIFASVRSLAEFVAANRPVGAA